MKRGAGSVGGLSSQFQFTHGGMPAADGYKGYDPTQQPQQQPGGFGQSQGQGYGLSKIKAWATLLHPRS